MTLHMQPDRWRVGEGRGRPEPQPGERQGGGRRVRARHRRGRRGGDRGGEGGVPGLVALGAARAARRAAQGRRRDHRAQGGARPAPVARGGQDAGRGHRRDGARGADLRLLRRRVPAARRRDRAVGAARRRRRDHPRGGGRGRADHALELPDRDPGLEDRAGARLRQHRRHQAGRPGAGLHLGDRRHPAPRRAAEGGAEPRHGQGLGGRPGDPRQPGRAARSASPAARGRARGSREASDQGACGASSSRWAARTRWWCSTTPTSARRSTARSTAPTSRPVSAAPPRRG